MRNVVTVSYGTAEISRVPFGDAQTPVHYRPTRWENTETVGAYTTERGRQRVIARTLRELRDSRRDILAETSTRRPSEMLFYRGVMGSLRFAEVRMA